MTVLSVAARRDPYCGPPMPAVLPDVLRCGVPAGNRGRLLSALDTARTAAALADRMDAAGIDAMLCCAPNGRICRSVTAGQLRRDVNCESNTANAMDRRGADAQPRPHGTKDPRAGQAARRDLLHDNLGEGFRCDSA